MQQIKQTVDRPLVSVILAIYNEAHSIQTCLDSILAQRTSILEIGE